MKEKKLISSFYLANIADSLITAYALTLPGFSEVGPFGSQAVENDQFHHAVMLKFAVTALLTGIYALSKHQHPRLEFVTEKALIAGNYIVWGVTTLNTLQVIEALSHVS